MKNIPRFKPFVFRDITPKERRSRAVELADELYRGRSIRQFSSRSVYREIIEEVIRAAGNTPSRAILQHWRFVVIGGSEVKRRIRGAAEVVDRKFYGERTPEKWLKGLSSLGTNGNKLFLEEVPWLIVVFAIMYGMDEDGKIKKYYYVKKSVGIAVNNYFGNSSMVG